MLWCMRVCTGNICAVGATAITVLYMSKEILRQLYNDGVCDLRSELKVLSVLASPVVLCETDAGLFFS